MVTKLLDKLPPCDFCSGAFIGITKSQQELDQIERAIVDGPTRSGPWGNMCKRHLESAGFPGLRSNIKLELLSKKPLERAQQIANLTGKPVEVVTEKVIGKKKGK